MRVFVFNEVMKMRRQIMLELAKNYEKGTLDQVIDKLPKEIRTICSSRHPTPFTRRKKLLNSE